MKKTVKKTSLEDKSVEAMLKDSIKKLDHIITKIDDWINESRYERRKIELEWQNERIDKKLKEIMEKK